MGKNSNLMRVDPDFKKFVRRIREEDDMIESDRQATKRILRLLNNNRRKIMRL